MSAIIEIKEEYWLEDKQFQCAKCIPCFEEGKEKCNDCGFDMNAFNEQCCRFCDITLKDGDDNCYCEGEDYYCQSCYDDCYCDECSEFNEDAVFDDEYSIRLCPMCLVDKDEEKANDEDRLNNIVRMIMQYSYGNRKNAIDEIEDLLETDF
jgi:hypothetical protein